MKGKKKDEIKQDCLAVKSLQIFIHYKSMNNELYILILHRNIIHTYILKIIENFYRVLTHISEILL